MSRRDEQQEFKDDVIYEAWRRGLNPDRAVECADDCYWNDRTPEQCVDGYARKVKAARERQENADEQYEPAE